ncbi:MAG: hypothetical protein ACYTF9_10290 [Planctomycetota bacterium]|jgi:hypothetical protein
MRYRSVLSGVAVIGALTIGSAAQADLVGSTVDIFGILGVNTIGVEVVDPGVEHSAFGDFGFTIQEDLDIFGSGFTYSLEASTDLIFTGDVFTITGLDFSEDVDLEIGAVTLVSGPAEQIASIEFADGPGAGSGSVTVTFVGQDSGAPSWTTLDFEFAITPVPAPSALAALVLAGCIGGRRRRA